KPQKLTEHYMKNYVSLVLVVLALGVFALAQTSNSKYEVTLFGAPPVGQNVWNLPRSVAADGKGTIYLLRASDPPVLIFNREGKLQKTWGNGLFKEAHSIDLDREGFLWITDREDNVVYKFTVDEQPAAKKPRVQIFDQNGTFIEEWANIGLKQPTGITVSGDDTVYIGDMDGNSITIVKNGKVLDVIGNVQARPHNVALDPA